MNCFTNVRTHVLPGMLSEIDLGLLQETINEILTPWKLDKKEGSFALVGQKRGERAQEILRFNFEDGRKGELDSPDDMKWGLYARTSDRAVESAIDELLRYPHKKLSDDYYPNPVNFGQLSSSIYYVGEPRAYAVVVNTTFGRFLASVSTEKIDLDVQVLAGVARAIRYRSGYADKIMVDSVNQISNNNTNIAQRIDAILDTVASNLGPSPNRIFFE